MPNIAISYRRSDSSALAGRIFDRLATHYGKHAVFMDVDAIPIGVDFRAHIDTTLRYTDVLLAVIGAQWLGAREGAAARISEATDPVRVEIETALARGAPIIPVLVDGAKMPEAGQLPPEFGAFAYLNAAEVTTGRDFHAQMDRLIAAIDLASAAKPAELSAVFRRDRAQARLQLGRDAARYFLRRSACCWSLTTSSCSPSTSTSPACGSPASPFRWPSAPRSRRRLRTARRRRPDLPLGSARSPSSP